MLKDLRYKTFLIIETNETSGKLSRFIDLFLIMLIAVNVTAVIFETVDSLYETYGTFFQRLEIFSVIIFSLEYILRLWVCPEREEYKDAAYPRWKYITSPMAIIDLCAILPFYLAFVVAFDLRFLRVLRLLRILKLTRYSSAMTLLLDAIREESSTFVSSFFLLFILLILAASGAFIVEHDAQPDKFASIPHAMWWAIITLTSVGYGDVSPVTPAGQFFGSMVSVIGVGVAALPAGILASGLADQVRKKRDGMRRMLIRILEDGVIDAEEEDQIEIFCKRHGISLQLLQETREQIEDEKESARNSFICPHCGKTAS